MLLGGGESRAVHPNDAGSVIFRPAKVGALSGLSEPQLLESSLPGLPVSDRPAAERAPTGGDDSQSLLLWL